MNPTTGKILATSTSATLALLVAPEDDGRWCVDVMDTVIRCYDVAGLLRTLREHACDLVVLATSITGSPSLRSLLDELRLGFPELLVLTFSDTAPPTLSFDSRVGAWVARRPQSADEFGEVTAMLLHGLDAIDPYSSGVRLGTHVARARQLRFNAALASVSMAFQPIVSLLERRAVAFEALLRAKSDAFPSPPALFDEAMRLDRVWDVSRMVRLRTAQRVEQAPSNALLFVNVHVRDLLDPWLRDERNPLLPIASRVVFELTEQADTSQIDTLPMLIQELRSRGYRVAVDDLGAGYSGLSVLAAIEPEFIKIDMSIIRGVDASRTKQRLIRSMVSLARELDARVICEGVETEQEASALRSLGADWLQGYYFGRPAAAFVEPVIGEAEP